METKFKTARESLDNLVQEKPVPYVRGGSIQLVKVGLVSLGGISLAVGTLYALADQHDFLKSITDPPAEFLENLIPGGTSYIDQAREKADWLLEDSGFFHFAGSIVALGVVTVGVGLSVWWAKRLFSDGFTSLQDSHYEHSYDGRTWKRHGGYTNNASDATRKYGKPLTPVDSQKDLDSLAEGDVAFINGAVLVKADFYNQFLVTRPDNTKIWERRHMTAEEFEFSWSGHNHEVQLIFELPDGVRIRGYKKSSSDLNKYAKLIKDAHDGKPIVRAEGMYDRNNVIQLSYIRPAYPIENNLAGPPPQS